MSWLSLLGCSSAAPAAFAPGAATCIFCEVVYMALMREHGSYLTADEDFICRIMDLGLFEISPFVGFSSSDRVIVEIRFKDSRTFRQSVRNRRKFFK